MRAHRGSQLQPRRFIKLRSCRQIDFCSRECLLEKRITGVVEQRRDHVFCLKLLANRPSRKVDSIPVGEAINAGLLLRRDGKPPQSRRKNQDARPGLSRGNSDR